jgi:hypothetical protein
MDVSLRVPRYTVATLPAAGLKGRIVYTTDDNQFRVDNGSAWVPGAGVTLPISPLNGGTGIDTSASTGVPTISSGTWSVAAQLSTLRGGTGLNASGASNGQLLIGNGSGFSLATLTQGTNVTIVNGAGTITISASGGGGGTGGLQCTPVSATFPNSNFPQLLKNVGTNWVDYTLDYDQTTEEAAYWYFAIPTGASFTGATIEIYCRTTVTTGNVRWKVTTITRAANEAWDSSGTTDTTTSSAVPGTAGQVHRQSLALTTTGWAASEVLLVKIARDVTVSGNAAADLKFIHAVITLTS